MWVENIVHSKTTENGLLPIKHTLKPTSADSIERVSIECPKTKTKVITLANQKGQRQSGNQSKPEVITRSRHKAWENVHVQATIALGFTSDWLKKRLQNFEPISE